MPTISKTAKLTAALFLILNITWLVFSVLYSFSGIIPLLASIGGEIVFLGLWIEKEADDEAKKEEHLPAELQLKAKVGWWILMVGISLEIATSFGLAAFDGYKNATTANAMAQIDPVNQPIISASALVTLSIWETNASTNPPDIVVWGNPSGHIGSPPPKPPAKIISLQDDSETVASGGDVKNIFFELYVTNLMQSPTVLECKSLKQGGRMEINSHSGFTMTLNFEVNLSEKQRLVTAAKSLFPPGTAFPVVVNFSVADFDKNGAAVLWMRQPLPDGLEIEDGTFSVTFNPGSIQRSFSLPKHSSGGLIELSKNPPTGNNK